MNKIISVLACTFLAASISFAQDEAPAKKTSNFGAGARIAFDYNMMYGFEEPDSYVDEDPSGIGFEGGVALRVTMMDNLFFAPEVNFSYAKTSHDYHKLERSYSNMALEIPFMIRGNVNDMVYVSAGPQINLSLSSSVEQEEGGNVTSTGLDKNTPDILKEDFEQGFFSFGLAVGFGVQIIENLYADLRFYVGLSQLFSDVALMYEDIDFDSHKRTWVKDGEEYTDGRSMMNMEGAKMMTIKIGLSYWFL